MKTYNIYKVDELLQFKNGTRIGGKWVCARPERFHGLLNRLKLAWLIFTGKIDGLEWYKQ